MSAWRLGVVPALVVAGALHLASSVRAVSCGQPDPEAKPPTTQLVRATLALDEKSSRTLLAFKET